MRQTRVSASKDARNGGMVWFGVATDVFLNSLPVRGFSLQHFNACVAVQRFFKDIFHGNVPVIVIAFYLFVFVNRFMLDF